LGIGQERSLSSALAERATSHTKKKSRTRKKSQSEREKHLTFFFAKGIQPRRIKENFVII